MPTNGLKITALAKALMSQETALRWALADSVAILAISQGKPVPRGPRGRLIRKALAVADRWHMAPLVVVIVGLLAGAQLRIRQGLRRGINTRVPKRVFVGFGAGIEDQLWSQYASKSDSECLRMNQVTLAGAECLNRPGIFSIWKNVVQYGWSIPARLRRACPTIISHRDEFLTSAAMKLAIYAYFRRLWENVPSDIEDVAFLAPDIPAFACVDAGLPTRFIQHGCIRRSLLIPHFNTIEWLTSDEKAYLKNVVPSATYEAKAWEEEDLGNLHQCILVASVYAPGSELGRAKDLIEWAGENGFKVVVRKHPRESSDFWKEHFPWCEIASNALTFREVLSLYKPALVVSWFSTALVESLQCGYLPVTVSDPDSDDIKDMVYPLMDRVLSWAYQEDLVKEALLFSEKRQEFVDRLRGRPGLGVGNG